MRGCEDARMRFLTFSFAKEKVTKRKHWQFGLEKAHFVFRKFEAFFFL